MFYLAEVMPHVRSEVISGKYLVQYIFAAMATAAVQPLISAIGVGWTFTICKLASWLYEWAVADNIFRCFLRYNKWFPCACHNEMGH